MNRYNKGFEEYRKSDYFKEKAQASQRTADKTQLKDKVYLCNRIKECDSLIKKYESYVVTAEEKQANGNAEAEKRIKKYLRELEYQIDKKAFMQNCLDELGGIFSKENIKKGYLILIRHGWAKVEKVNTKTVYCKYLEAPLNDWVSKVDYSEIQQIKVPEGFKEEKEEIKNPYKVNDILVTYNISGNRVITAYQVIKVTPKGIQIQKINIENNKPIKDSFTLDKPCRKKVVKSNYNNFIGCYDGDWQLHPYNNNESVAI